MRKELHVLLQSSTRYTLSKLETFIWKMRVFALHKSFLLQETRFPIFVVVGMESVNTVWNTHENVWIDTAACRQAAG